MWVKKEKGDSGRDGRCHVGNFQVQNNFPRQSPTVKTKSEEEANINSNDNDNNRNGKKNNKACTHVRLILIGF